MIKGGRVVDATGDRMADVLVQGGVVAAVGRRVDGAPVLDAGGCIVAPGLVDLHAHLREPGDEDAETIDTGARAAALGGFTAVVAMPNTRPPLDDAAVVASVLAAGRASVCDVAASGCITKGRLGEELAPMGELHALGVRIFTDDGAHVGDAGVMRNALEYARALPGAVVAQHAEDPTLAAGGHMHEGAWSSRLGIPGRSGAAEATVVARDVMLAELTGTPVHFLHLSTAAAVDLVRDAKERGRAERIGSTTRARGPEAHSMRSARHARTLGAPGKECQGNCPRSILPRSSSTPTRDRRPRACRPKASASSP